MVIQNFELKIMVIQKSRHNSNNLNLINLNIIYFIQLLNYRSEFRLDLVCELETIKFNSSDDGD